MFLTINAETVEQERKCSIKQKGANQLRFEIIKEFYGKMSGKTINNHMEYFLAHVKNDIDIISKELHFENPVDIFDWLRAVLPLQSNEFIFKSKTATDATKNPLLDVNAVTQPSVAADRAGKRTSKP